MATPPTAAPLGAGPATSSLFAEATNGLTPALLKRCEEIFAGFEFIDEGRTYLVGPIIRRAWEAEKSIPPSVAARVATLVQLILEGTAPTAYARPGCCTFHKTTVSRNFSLPILLPPDKEMLAALAQLVWALCPDCRGILSMNPTSSAQTYSVSRFMVFENFLSWHDRDVMTRSQPMGDAVLEYSRLFSPSRHPALRRADLRRRIADRAIRGMIGARPDQAPMTPGDPHYCDQRRPFATPRSKVDGASRTTAPDRELRKLGLIFNKKTRYVELMYKVDIAPDASKAVGQPTVPTVIDAEGYWLFRPDRAHAPANGLLWNHARDIATDKRGGRELISAPLSINNLTDLIVWPQLTVGNWATLSASSLSKDIAI